MGAPLETMGVEEDQIGGLPKWQVESDLRSLEEAGEINADGKRLKAVRKLAKRKAKVLQKLTGGSGGFRDLDEGD